MDAKIFKFFPTIADHDLNTKIRQIDKNLSKGHYIKCFVELKGRNALYPENGDIVLDKILKSIKNGKLVNRKPFSGSQIEMFLAPLVGKNDSNN